MPGLHRRPALRTLRPPAATFTGQNAEKNRAGLIAKLDAASAKLGEGKIADAIQKLGDFRAQVAQLQAQGKLGAGEAAALLAGADAAIACLQAELATP